MKSIIVLLAEGFEEVEALTCVDVFRRAKLTCYTVSINNDEFVTGSHGISVKVDRGIDSINVCDYDCIVLPGGMPGANNLKKSKKVIDLVRDFNSSNKLIAAICAAPIVLNEAGIIKNSEITSYPDFKDELECKVYKEDIVAECKNIITSRGPATAIYFAYKILEKLGKIEEAKALKEGMLVDFVENKLK